MINPEDLRIGDLVKVSRDCMFPKGTICTVLDINPPKVFKDKKGVVTLSAVNDDDDGPWGVWCSNTEGIPLTSEILELNGWNKRTFNIQLKKSVREKYEYRLPQTALNIEYCPYYMQINERFTVYGDCFMIKHIEYVHELQHILWVLGLDAELNV